MNKKIKTVWITTIFSFGFAIIVCINKQFSLIESFVVLGVITLIVSIMWLATLMDRVIDRIGKET